VGYEYHHAIAPREPKQAHATGVTRSERAEGANDHYRMQSKLLKKLPVLEEVGETKKTLD